MKKDLQRAFYWFTHPNNIQQTYLTTHGMQIVDELQIALSTHSLSQARQISNNLFLDGNRDNKEIGEILVRGAIYAFLLGGDENYQFAKEQFQNAVGKYLDNEAHHRAISLWFLGFIYWHVYGYSQDAFLQWEYCLRVLNQLSYSHTSENPNWYQKIRFQVLESLFLTRIMKKYYPLSQVKYFQLRPPIRAEVQPSASAKSSGKSKPQIKRIKIRSFPVYQYVPAGGWGVVEPEQVGYTEMDNFAFDGVPHRAVDLLGHGQVTIREQEQYAIVRIKGTSMKKLNILSEDYVLIRRQEDANHEDIVLAEHINVDREATLKRFYKQGNTIELQPESDDPKHKVLPINKRDELRILGIAIAVFKAIPLDGIHPETSELSSPSPSDKGTEG